MILLFFQFQKQYLFLTLFAYLLLFAPAILGAILMRRSGNAWRAKSIWLAVCAPFQLIFPYAGAFLFYMLFFRFLQPCNCTDGRVIFALFIILTAVLSRTKTYLFFRSWQTKTHIPLIITAADIVQALCLYVIANFFNPGYLSVACASLLC